MSIPNYIFWKLDSSGNIKITSLIAISSDLLMYFRAYETDYQVWYKY